MITATQHSTRLGQVPLSAGALALDPDVVVTPIRREHAAPGLADQLILAVATADDVSSALKQVVAMLHRAGGAERVEWWRPERDGSSMQLETADGTGHGRRVAFPLGPLGALVVVGERSVPELASALPRLVPILRRRWTDEQLADHSGRLARRVESLEDFAALVAHELKSPLHAALLGGNAEAGVEKALELIDSLLEVARAEVAAETRTSAADCLANALKDLGPIGARVVADLPHRIPISPATLRLLMRNLVANAVAAGSQTIHVRSTASPDRWTVTVADDGVGLDGGGRYTNGSGLGLNLCRRLAERLGGELELEPRPDRGTRATLMIAIGVEQ